MNDGEYVDESPANAVRYYPRRSGDYEFPGSWDSAGTSRRGMPSQDCRRFLDPVDDLFGSVDIVRRDIFKRGVDIGARLARPADSHLRRREKVAFIWASVANSPASACRRPSRM